MKNALLLISAISLISFSAMAGDVKIINSCSAKITLFPETVDVKFDIVVANNQVRAITTQKIDGEVVSQSDISSMQEFSVRSGLVVGHFGRRFNLAENIITNAMAKMEDSYSYLYSTGLDLKEIRYATVYAIGDQSDLYIGELTPEGRTSAYIVEARDLHGKKLGSFLGGVFVSACK